MSLTLPTADRIRKACAEFDAESRDAEEALSELFRQYPKNTITSHVLLKASTLNTFYSTRIPLYAAKVPNLFDVARHIQMNAERIDSGYERGEPGIVDLIGEVKVSGKAERNYFSFASKFCSWHNPAEYPIWDSRVEWYLTRLRKETDFAPEFDIGGRWKYPAFRKAMEEFRERYRLVEFSFKEIDKFLWSYGAPEQGRAQAAETP